MDYTYLYRLREIVRRLKSGQVDKTTLVDNLEYAADVLENVYKVETLYGHFLLPFISLYRAVFVFRNSAFAYITFHKIRY